MLNTTQLIVTRLGSLFSGSHPKFWLIITSRKLLSTSIFISLSPKLLNYSLHSVYTSGDKNTSATIRSILADMTTKISLWTISISHLSAVTSLLLPGMSDSMSWHKDSVLGQARVLVACARVCPSLAFPRCTRFGPMWYVWLFFIPGNYDYFTFLIDI